MMMKHMNCPKRTEAKPKPGFYEVPIDTPSHTRPGWYCESCGIRYHGGKPDPQYSDDRRYYFRTIHGSYEEVLVID